MQLLDEQAEGSCLNLPSSIAISLPSSATPAFWCGTFFLTRCSFFFFSESRFSTGILQKLFQGTAKPSSAETIDNRVDPTRQEVGKVGYVAAPIHSGIIRLGRSQDCKADGRNVARYECEDSNDDSFGSLDITLKSGLSLESR